MDGDNVNIKTYEKISESEFDKVFWKRNNSQNWYSDISHCNTTLIILLTRIKNWGSNLININKNNNLHYNNLFSKLLKILFPNLKTGN